MDFFRDQSSQCLFDSFNESVSLTLNLFLICLSLFDPFTIPQTISV